MTIQKIHPDLSCYRLELLNPYSHNLFFCREYSDERGEFHISIKVKFSGWFKARGQSEEVWLNDTEIEIWRCDSVDDANAFIALMRKLKANVFPNQ
jgi:hypothetical protein